ncbi:MAG TPA: hypothetical protein VEA19_03570 [Actinomycetota bacterium]|nr:hypothetical protein [Actinomycetota bacterium]
MTTRPIDRVLISLLALAAVAGGMSGAHAEPAASEADAAYTVTDLGTFGGELANGFGVNDLSEAVGRAEIPTTATKGFLWRDGELIDLGALNSSGNGTTAHAINDRGEIAGESMAPDPQFNGLSAMPMFWSAETGMVNLAQDLTRTGTGRARGINDHGDVVGIWRNRAFRWSRHAGYRELDLLPDALWAQAEAFSINDQGVAVGWGTDPKGFKPAVRWAPDGSIDLLPRLPGGMYGTGLDVNDRGEIAGESEKILESGAKRPWPVLWRTDGSIEEIPMVPAEPPLDMGAAEGINDRGEIVGVDRSSAWGDGRQVGWIRYTDGRKVVLNDLIDPNNGWDIRIPTDINNHGDIVGIGILTKDGIDYPGRAFLMRKKVAVIGDRVRVTGGATFGGAPVQVGESAIGSSPTVVPGAGMDLASASVRQSTQHTAVFEMRVHDMPADAGALPEAVHYEWPFQVKRGAAVVGAYTLQAIRSAQAVSPGSTDPAFRLLECAPDPAGAQCTQKATLSGAFTATGVQINLPVAAIGGPGVQLVQDREGVSTSLGVSGLRSGLGGDRMAVGPLTLFAPTVSVGIAPLETPDEEVPLTGEGVVYADGTYRGDVQRPEQPGEYKVVAMPCLGPESCSPVVHRVTIPS